MVSSSLIRPDISWGNVAFGGVPLDCHDLLKEDINPCGIRSMSFIIGKQWELIDPIAHMALKTPHDIPLYCFINEDSNKNPDERIPTKKTGQYLTSLTSLI